MTAIKVPSLQDAATLYETYGKPLEQEHRGKYVAISRSGDVVIGDTRLETAQRAVEQFGRGVFLFKIGERAVGRWR